LLRILETGVRGNHDRGPGQASKRKRQGFHTYPYRQIRREF
jgi:hypothetical protein